MSEVISFRLNSENPREAEVIHALQAWRLQGYSIRRIITDALLKFDQHEQEQESTALVKELHETLNQVNDLLSQIEGGKSLPVTKGSEGKRDEGLSASFIASVKKSAKSCLQLD